MSQPLTLTLPWPPSVNTYWRRVGNKTILSKAARAYRTKVSEAVLEQGALRRVRWPADARLKVGIHAEAPDRRARDLDNLPKGILDALVHAGVLQDDSFIDDLRITRGATGKPGRVSITITNLEEEAA